MLYLIATPIGHLGDLTCRALEILKLCDLLYCEDTRRSRTLLNHYQVQQPLKSYHLFNEAKREPEIIAALEDGKTVGLLSDAGTPTINDPGSRLVKKCIEKGLDVCPLPGACSPIVALVGSGLSTEKFQFIGFLPKKPGKQKKALLQALEYEGTTICFESPHRLLKALKAIDLLAPEREVVTARELTKKYEEFQRGVASELLVQFSDKPPKGEFVLMIAGSY